jgi:hypothetical protein
MADDNHVSPEDLAGKHDEGQFGCLTRHKRRSEHPCSHQWQAKLHALADSGVYDWNKYESLCDTAQGGILRTALGRFWMKAPTSHSWDVGQSGNFDHFRRPYWHNAHHIIPNGALNSFIDKTEESDYRLPNLIRQELLIAKYNLNDKENMVILPMERRVANALGLPRHLLRDEGGPNDKMEFFSHADYSREVEGKLRDIVNDYKSLLDASSEEAGEEHRKAPGQLSKEKLENLSKTIYKEIKTQGAGMGGAALSNMDLSQVSL